MLGVGEERGIGSIYWPPYCWRRPMSAPESSARTSSEVSAELPSEAPLDALLDAPSTTPSELSARLDPEARWKVRQRLLAATESPWLNQEIGRRMAERLTLIRQAPASVLVWPADDGALLPELRSACPAAQLQRVVEHRPPAQTDRSWWARLRGAPALPELAPAQLPAGQAALLWSVMRLHWDADPRALLAAWRRAIAPEGFVMYATLGPGSLPQLRQIYARLGWGPALVNPIDMHDLGDMMVEAGFADPVMDQELLRLTYASPQALLAELRSLGANCAPARFAGLRTPRWRVQLEAELNALAGPDGRIPLELEVVYGHAFRAPERGPAVTADTRIALADMKSMLRRRPT